MRCRAALIAAVATALVFPAAAGAATLNPHFLPMAGLLDEIGKVIFGGLEFGAKELGKLVLSLIAGIADMIVPDSWGKKGVEFIKWLAAIPDYTGKGFSDFHQMRRMTLGLALILLPVTMTWAGAAWMFGTERSEPLGAIITRTLTVIILLISWGTVWKTVPALGNQLTNAFLSMPSVSTGLQKYMEVAVAGGLLGSIPFLGALIWMLAAFLLVCGVGLKVFILLLGGILYFVGPLLLAVAPLQAGSRLLRRYMALFVAIPVLPLAFAIIFTAAALFIKGAAGIGTAIGGSSVFGAAAGSIIAGFSAILGPLLCFGVAKRMLGPGMDSLKGTVSNFSPAASLGKAKASLAAARGGVTGRSAGQTATSAHGAAGPRSAMQSLSESRIGVRQAIQVGAGFAGLGAKPTTPARAALQTAQITARGGAAALAGVGVGYATAGARANLAGRGGVKGMARDAATKLRTPDGRPNGTAAAHEAAVHSLRPEGFRGPQEPGVEPKTNGRKPPARSTADSPAARLPGASPEPLRAEERAKLAGTAGNGRPNGAPTHALLPDRGNRGPSVTPDSTIHLPAGGRPRTTTEAPMPSRSASTPSHRPDSGPEASTPRPTQQRPDSRPRPERPAPTPRPDRRETA